ncbi:MAG TPA: molybdate ABC transporter substrate-binding protein [Acidimicrobiales bacterium]|nr:molybdate ABC transporter substrate-binding protein [Acidimicrobiales bacterium]
MRTGRLALVSAVGLALSSCGSARPSATPTTAASATAIDVFAAASLTGASTAATTALAASAGVRATYNFGGSNTLVTQILQGAPADVFASADRANMGRLVAAGLVETPVTFARNRLEIAVAPGNPKHIAGPADLARRGVNVVMEAPGVPAGDYARALFGSEHLGVRPVSLETDVKSALAKVTSGEADATVVYATDVAAAGAATSGVPIAPALQPDITYPIAVVKATRHRAAAEAFVRSAVSGAVQRDLEAAGFLPPR